MNFIKRLLKSVPKGMITVFLVSNALKAVAVLGVPLLQVAYTLRVIIGGALYTIAVVFFYVSAYFIAKDRIMPFIDRYLKRIKHKKDNLEA